MKTITVVKLYVKEVRVVVGSGGNNGSCYSGGGALCLGVSHVIRATSEFLISQINGCILLSKANYMW